MQADPIQTMRRFIQEFQAEGNEAVANELLAEDFVDHTPFPGVPGNKQGVIALLRGFHEAFADVHIEIHEQLLDADGERVATRKTFHGLHRGPFAGTPASGKRVAIHVMDVVRVANGQLREHWSVVDLAGFLTQTARSNAA